MRTSLRRILALVISLTLLMAMTVPFSAQAAKQNSVKKEIRYKIQTLNTNFLLSKKYKITIQNTGNEDIVVSTVKANPKNCTVDRIDKVVRAGNGLKTAATATFTIQTPRGTCATCCFTVRPKNAGGTATFTIDAPNVDWVMRDN